MPKVTVTYTAAEVAEEMRKAGFTVDYVAEANPLDLVDGEVNLPELKAYVQVGEGYLSAVFENGRTFDFGPELTDIHEVVARLKQRQADLA